MSFSPQLQKILIKKIILTNKTYKRLLINSFFLTSTNKEEAKSLIKKVNTFTSVSPYSIPTNTFILSFIKIFQIFFDGIFPNLLKFANVISVLLKRNNLDYNNYRSIILTSKVVKLIEKIVLESGTIH